MSHSTIKCMQLLRWKRSSSVVAFLRDDTTMIVALSELLPVLDYGAFHQARDMGP